MYGVESSTYAPEMVYTGTHRVSPPPPPPDASELTQDNLYSNGFATTAMDTLTTSLNASGFVSITGGVLVNFNMLVDDPPQNSVHIEELSPGVMSELAAWVASKLEGSPQAMQDAQARVNPQRAVSLLR